MKRPWIVVGRGVVRSAARWRKCLGKAPHVCVVTDRRLARSHAGALTRTLRSLVPGVSSFILPAGEKAKDLTWTRRLTEHLLRSGAGRDAVLAAVGGGSVTDAAGFAAATYMRGIRWVAVPTTLLGQIDSGIGGKTAVDLGRMKNILGAFHQPAAVFCDIGLLKSLPRRERISGLAEAVKCGLIWGPPLLTRIRRDWSRLLRGDAAALGAVVSRCAAGKAAVVSRDFRETRGRRESLNFGHTTAHALESVTGLRRFRHGEAVAWGMRVALRLSSMSAGLPGRSASEADSLLARIPVPPIPRGADPVRLWRALLKDKKCRNGRPRFVLLRRIGRPVVREGISSDDFKRAFEAVSGGPKRMLVLHGPNLDLLGEREPGVYGRMTLAQLDRRIRAHAKKRRVRVRIRQSNIEGKLIDLIHRNRKWAHGIVINPAGYTHTSVAIRDAIAAVGIPTVEVHLTDTRLRERFRRRSMIAPVCAARVQGRGWRSYTEGIDRLLRRG